MYKKIMLFIFILLNFPIFVYARSASSSVYTGNNLNECTSKYQDNSISINKDIYFGHCMEYTCRDSKTKYYTSNGVTCSNGNTDPYVKMEKNGCNNLSCTSSEKSNSIVKYCSVLMYYDCSRKSNGDSFYATTKRTTTKGYNTTTTTTQVIEPTSVVVNTKLSSLFLSSGSIEFNSDINEYEIEVDSSISSINVNAVPVDSNSKVDISGNSNIVNGSVISITVTGSDGSTSQYKIKVNKKEEIKLSSNAKLKTLIIDGYDIDFNSNKFDYTLIINDNIKELDMSMETEDIDARISDVSGNSNLKDGSKVVISITAPDGVTINKYNINIKVKKKSNFVKILFIFILILSLLCGAYYIYKKFVLSKSGDKYEYE